VFWKSIKRLWSSGLVEVVVVAAAVAAAVVIEVSIEEADNQVVRADVAVVGNNSDAALEAEATAEAAVVVVLVALDEATVLDAEENAHKKKEYNEESVAISDTEASVFYCKT
jgi:hypothetical protein